MWEQTLSNYEKNCQEWIQRFQKMDQERLMELLPELKAEGDYLTLYHFHHKYGIHRKTGEIADLEEGLPVSATLKLNIYTLLGYVTPHAHFQDQWVPFEKLKNMAPFGPAFKKGILQPYAATFSGHMNELEHALIQIGGEKIPYSDVGYQVKAFECIPARFLFWEGDDEFPAQANMLFDISATDFIHGESIVTISMVGLTKLADLTGLPVAKGAFVTNF